MRKLLFFIAVLAGVIFMLPAQLKAQTVDYTVDTLDIAVLPAGNINTIINGDTVLGGSRQHPNRVYRLKPGAIYQVTQPMIINGKITVTSRDTTAGVRPPVLAPAILLDNSSIDHYFEFDESNGSGEIHNVYFLSVRSDGNQLGWSDAIRVYGDSVALKLRGCVFDAFSDCALKIQAQWTKMDVQDCTFRNLQHATSWFGGQAMETDAPNAMDTCKFINNTFFSCNSYLWSIRGYDVYSVFAHNTIVYGIVNPFLMRSGVHMHLNNNLFYAAHSMGGNPEHVIQGWFLNYPDTASSSIIRIRCYDTVSAWSKLWNAAINGENANLDVAHGVTSDMLNPADRSFELLNNVYYWPQKFENYYTTYNDTVTMKDSVDMPDGSKQLRLRTLIHPTWISAYAQWTIDSMLSKQSTHVNVANNTSADPGFTTDVANQMDSALAYVGKIVEGTMDRPWFFKASSQTSLYPPVWPLPENLAYSNTAMQSAGSDGFAVGDLNWFPSQKAQFTNVKLEKGPQVPSTFSLSNAYPNPFNPTTNIKFNLAKDENVKLVVFNILGQKVRTLVNGDMKAGEYTATWDGRDEFGSTVASGIYFYRLESQSFNATKKMILMK